MQSGNLPFNIQSGDYSVLIGGQDGFPRQSIGHFDRNRSLNLEQRNRAAKSIGKRRPADNLYDMNPYNPIIQQHPIPSPDEWELQKLPIQRFPIAEHHDFQRYKEDHGMIHALLVASTATHRNQHRCETCLTGPFKECYVDPNPNPNSTVKKCANCYANNHRCRWSETVEIGIASEPVVHDLTRASSTSSSTGSLQPQMVSPQSQAAWGLGGSRERPIRISGSSIESTTNTTRPSAPRSQQQQIADRHVQANMYVSGSASRPVSIAGSSRGSSMDAGRPQQLQQSGPATPQNQRPPPA